MSDGFDRYVNRKIAFYGYFGLPALYFYALFKYPDYWAIATGIVFVLVSGFVTGRIFLSLENPWAVIGLTPVFGGAWLGFFWLLFKIAG